MKFKIGDIIRNKSGRQFYGELEIQRRTVNNDGYRTWSLSQKRAVFMPDDDAENWELASAFKNRKKIKKALGI